MKKRFIAILVITATMRGQELYAQTKIAPAQYIDLYAATAVREMEESGIPASITLAQGLLESDNGNSPLATTANNHFGIKCHKEWTGDTYYHDDDEKNECFRYYQNAAQSYDDHTEFLKTRSRYAFLFSYSRTDYVSWANGLKLAGYATNPQYPTLLVNLINRYDLSKYDMMQSKEMSLQKEAPTPVITTKSIPTQAPINIKQQPIDEGVVVETQAFYNEVFLLNNIKAIKAKVGDTPMGIAMKYNVPINYLIKYNDMFEGENFVEGQNVFIQPKRSKGNSKQHIVTDGESMYEMSQKYGVKLTELYKKNQLEPGLEVCAGELILLREDNTNTPKSMSYEQFVLLKNKETTKQPIINKSAETKQVEKLNSPNLSIEQIQKSIEQKTTITSNDSVDKPIEGQLTATEAVQPQLDINDSEEKKSTILIADTNIEAKNLAAPLTTKTATQSHVVKQGDTLYNISKRYGVSVSNIILWNNLLNNNINLGQTLIVSN